jgi:hypothetical protein
MRYLTREPLSAETTCGDFAREMLTRSGYANDRSLSALRSQMPGRQLHTSRIPPLGTPILSKLVKRVQQKFGRRLARAHPEFARALAFPARCS